MFDLYRSWFGQVGSWDLRRKDAFGVQRFQFLGDYDIGAGHEKIGPCRVANEEVDTLKGKRCIEYGGIKREVGFSFKL